MTRRRPRRLERVARSATGALLVAGSALAVPPRPDPQDDAPRYTGALLSCAVFREQVRSHIRSRRAITVVEDRAGRDGVLVVRAADSAGELRVEAWYDSLTVWRESAAGRELADPEGFLGGRYRGTLSPVGVFRRVSGPFVPDNLAALVNLADAFDDFLPRLPPARLDPGGRWPGGSGLEIQRLPDGRLAGERTHRYQWTRKRAGERPLVPGDSVEATVSQKTSETGDLSWSPAFGPLAWYRKIDVEATVPPRAGVTQPFVSTVRQEVWVTRAPAHPACAANEREGMSG